MKLTPVGDRALIEREPSKSKTEGGIIIPDPQRKESSIGKIIRLGPGIKNEKIKVGQRVVFTDYHTTQAEDNDLFIVDEEDIEVILVA